MDRLYRNLAGSGLALTLVLAGAGCRTPRSEVPPSPAFSGNGQAPDVGFSKAPNPIDGPGSAGMPPAGGGQFGTPSPSSTPSYGPSAGGAFSAPGSNLGTQSSMPSPLPTGTAPGTGSLASPGGASNPMSGIPQTGTGPSGPAAGVGAAPTQNPLDR